jgi:hypothetical protein
MFWGYITKDSILIFIFFLFISKGLVKNQIHMYI